MTWNSGRAIFFTPYAELGDDALERHVLVVEDLHRFGADAAEKLCEWGIAREIEAKCNGVHEEPNEGLDFGKAAIRHRRADNDVGRAGVAVKQGRQRRDQHHEQRGLLPLAEQPQPGDQRPIERNAALGAAERAFRGSRPIEWQRGCRRRIGQSRAPERQLPFDGVPLQPRALPRRVVAVLKGKLGQRIGLALADGLVERCRLAHQDAERPPVADDVVQIEKHDMVAFRHADKIAPKQLVLGEVKRLGGSLS